MSSVAIVLDQHGEEASFLAILRDHAVRAPHYDLKQLATLDNRIEAHLDGLQVAGLKGLNLLLEQLTPNASGEVFAATVLAFELDNAAALSALGESLRASPEAERYFAAALGWLDWSRVQPWIDRLLVSPDPLFRRLGLAACGMHRQDPGPALVAGLSHADPGVVARAARTAGELRRRDLLPLIRTQRLHGDEALRFWANWATLQMGDEEAFGPLRLLAEQPGAFRLRALNVLLCWQPREASIAWLRGLMQNPAHRRLVIQASGLFGDPQTIPWLIQQMHELPYARVAGEAFSLITGADLAERDLEREVYPDYDAGPNDDPEDGNVQLDPDTDLAWPDPLRVAAWWQANQAGFENGKAYLMGAAFSEQQCLNVLRTGQQRQRIAAACLLARHIPTRALFPTSAPASRQSRGLDSAQAL